MNKADIVETLSLKLDRPKLECQKIFETVTETITEELERGEKVLLSGFGRFSVRSKNARIGRNLQTIGRAIISARKVVTFKASPILRDRVNRIEDEN